MDCIQGGLLPFEESSCKGTVEGGVGGKQLLYGMHQDILSLLGREEPGYISYFNRPFGRFFLFSRKILEFLGIYDII